MSKYSNLGTFVLLFALLGIPFALKTVAPRLEVYPSVILPSGASVTSTHQGTVEIISRELYGLKADSGELFRLDPARFIAPIPVQYLSTFLGETFGLDAKGPTAIWLRKIGVFHLQPRSFSEEQKQETREWLKQRLISNGCRPDQLTIRKIRRLHDRETHETIKTSVIDEEVIKLT